MVKPLLAELHKVASEIEFEKERTIALRVRLHKERLAHSMEQQHLKKLMETKIQELNELRQSIQRRS